jgi:hypothetical protein
MRKSILSALYGISFAEGKIKLDSTLKQLDIDDYRQVSPKPRDRPRYAIS